MDDLANARGTINTDAFGRNGPAARAVVGGEGDQGGGHGANDRVGRAVARRRLAGDRDRGVGPRPLTDLYNEPSRARPSCSKALSSSQYWRSEQIRSPWNSATV